MSPGDRSRAHSEPLSILERSPCPRPERKKVGVRCRGIRQSRCPDSANDSLRESGLGQRVKRLAVNNTNAESIGRSGVRTVSSNDKPGNRSRTVSVAGKQAEDRQLIPSISRRWHRDSDGTIELQQVPGAVASSPGDLAWRRAELPRVCHPCQSAWRSGLRSGRNR